MVAQNRTEQNGCGRGVARGRDRALIGWFVMSLVVGCFVDSEIFHVGPVLFASGEVRLSAVRSHVLLGVAFACVGVTFAANTRVAA